MSVGFHNGVPQINLSGLVQANGVGVDSTVGSGSGGITSIQGDDAIPQTGPAQSILGGGGSPANSGLVFNANGADILQSYINYLNFQTTPDAANNGTLQTNGNVCLSFPGVTNSFLGNGVGPADLSTIGGANNIGAGNGTFAAMGTGAGVTWNIGIGDTALPVVTGTRNICIGSGTLPVTSGSYNTAVGFLGGSAYTAGESSNILLGSIGINGESNALHLGDTGTGNGQVDKAYIAGIAGVTVSNAQLVSIDTTTGQLGSVGAYAEGTFTPTLVGGTVAGTTTYSTQSANYIKIGRLVYVQVFIQISAATGTGDLTLGGLPFTSLSSNGLGNGSCTFIGGILWAFPAGATSLSVLINPSATTATIYASGTTIAGGRIQMVNAGLQIFYSLTYNAA